MAQEMLCFVYGPCSADGVCNVKLYRQALVLGTLVLDIGCMLVLQLACLVIMVGFGWELPKDASPRAL